MVLAAHNVTSRDAIHRKANTVVNKSAIAPAAILALSSNETVPATAPVTNYIGDLTDLAQCAYNAENSKALFLTKTADALGLNPSEDTIKIVRVEIVVGITASRLPVDEFPRKSMTISERLAFARKLVTEGQAPTEVDSDKPAKLRKGNTCFRNGVQHRTIRNAEQRASKYLAELDAGNAKTDAEDNAGRKARQGGGDPSPHHGKETAPDVDTLKPAGPVDGVQYAATLLHMLSTAMQYDNKHAKVRPIEYSAIADGIAALHTTALEADKAFHARLAAAQEKKPAKRQRKAN